MLKKNLTPYQVATKLTSRRPPQAEMMVVVRATYALGPDGSLTVVKGPMDQRFLSAETFAEGDDERAGGCIYPSDFADFKLNAEVMLKGSCHAAGGKALTECLVRFGVGGWSKTLRVTGRRAWSDAMPGAVPSAPLSFKSMPLTWGNAFGGADVAENPSGKGLGDELPTVEYPDAPLKRRAQRPKPASFGPVNPAWPPRAGKLGTQYGKSWRESRRPFYAEDFDWSHFHAAPADQQLEGYLRGDEKLLFQNLHPESPTLEARLPGVRVRVMIHDDGGRFREATMSLDTLLADLDEGRIELTFRGLVPVREHDFDDVKSILIAEEKIGERRTEAEYREMLAAFEQDPLGFAAALPPGFDDVIARAEATQRGEPPPLRQDLDPISARVDRHLGKLGEETTKRVAEQVARARAQVADRKDIGPDLDKVAAAIDDSPPLMRVVKPGGRPPAKLRSTMRALLEQVQKARESASNEHIPKDEAEKVHAKLTEAEAIPLDPRWKEIDPRYEPPTRPVSTDEPGPGKDLSERDLTGADLRGRDLRGADLTLAILTRADLSGADLSGAVLRDAVLFKTNLTEARLVGADLSRANLAQALARRADLTGTNLEMTFFEDTDLGGAKLVEADAGFAIFTRAKLEGADLRGAKLERADLEGADVTSASFVAAKLGGAKLEGAKGRRASFRGAEIAGASFTKGDFAEASFADARGERAIFEGATLDGADLSHADLPRSHFTKVSAKGASLLRANLPESRFYKARLDEVDAREANLFRADLASARLTRTRFGRANLFEASFLGAAGDGTDFLEANLKRSTLEGDR